MSVDHVSKTIEMVQGQIAQLDRELQDKKRMVNDLCRLAGRPPVYGEADLVSSVASTSTLPDEYYGQPLATVVRTVLEKRRAAKRGAATVTEIFDEMVAGGYAFGGKNDENSKRGLYVSLGKNTATFHKLPNGTYGLREWYPDLKDTKGSKTNGPTRSDESDEKPLHEELQEEVAAEVAEMAGETPAKAK